MTYVWIYLGDKDPHYFQPVVDFHRRQYPNMQSLYIRRPATSFKSWATIPEMRTFGFFDGPLSFWGLTAFRLFALGEIMEAHGLGACIHCECDNILYANPDEISQALVTAYGPRIAVCPLANSSATAGVMYVGDFDRYKEFTHQLVMLMRKGGQHTLNRIGGDMAPNEMHMLRIMAEDFPDMVQFLPTLPRRLRTYAAPDLPWLFDAGSYGQRLGGNGPYSHHFAGKRMLEGEIIPVWQPGRPHVIAADGETYPLANLHVHNKETEVYTW